MSTSWAGLGGVVWLDFLDGYTFPLSYVFQCVPEEAVGDAVSFLSALLAPFTLALSEISKAFNSDVSIKLLGEFDDFVAYLPHSCSDIVSLFSAEPLELESSLASGNGVSTLLELRPSFLKPELFRGNVLPIIRLLQNLIFADDGYGYLGAVDVNAHSIRSDDGFRRGFGEDGEEPQVLLHDDACQLPALLKVFLKSLIGSVLADGKPYSGVVKSEAENRITSPSFFEAEESPVEADDTFPYALIYGPSDAPSVACGFNYELGRYAVFAPKLLIGLLVELSPRLDAVKKIKGFFCHVEEGSVCFPKQPFLSLRRLEEVQRQTLPHVAIPKFRMSLAYL